MADGSVCPTWGRIRFSILETALAGILTSSKVLPFCSQDLYQMNYRIVSVVLLLFIVGCESEKKVVPVSGVVLLDGAPLQKAYVTLQPVGTDANENAGYSSVGFSDKDGKFNLVVQHPKEDLKGAYVGEHRLVVSKMKVVGAGGASEETMPAYCSGVNPLLRVVIPEGGTNNLRIEIWSDQKNRNKQPTEVFVLKP